MEKPPIGIMPKQFHDKLVREQRFVDLCGAIVRYYEANRPINVEWIIEYNELINAGVMKEKV